MARARVIEMELRLFLGVALPPPAKQTIAALTTELLAHAPGWRGVDETALHLTLRFFGATPLVQLPELRARYAAIAPRHSAVICRLVGGGAFPQRPRRPRILWIGVRDHEPLLEALARDCEQTARALGFAAETRPFRPHVTIARALADRAIVVPTIAAQRCLGELPLERITLWRSHLESRGARYEVLDEWPLSAAESATVNDA